MCGRFYIDPESNAELLSIVRNLDRRLQSKQKIAQIPEQKFVKIKTGEIFPSDYVPTVSKSQPVYDVMQWGYKNPYDSKLLINARAETIMEKPLFSGDFINSRVVIPATGFFEWTHSKEKNKYLFYNESSPMIYMAGISKTDLITSRFVILTTSANTCMKDIHNRIPVLLTREEVALFLSSKEFAVSVLQRESLNLSRRTISKQEFNQLILPVHL